MQINEEVVLRNAWVKSMTWYRDRPQLLYTDSLQALTVPFADFIRHSNFEENKGEIENLGWVRVDEACTTPASALVFNRETQHGAIKAFIVFSRSGLGT